MEEIFQRELERKRLFRNRDLLSPHYVPENLPHREKQIEMLGKILAPLLAGKRADNVFIYGKTGTGKTAVARYVLKKLEEFAKKHNVKVFGVYINCRIHHTKYRVFEKIATVLYPGRSFSGFSASHLYDRILEKLDLLGAGLVVVLDEVDKLRGVSDVIYALSRANDELTKGKIVIVGISNDLLFKERLDARTRSSLCQQEILFPPYNAEELKGILRARAQEAFQEGVVDDSAIALAAALAAKKAGDARYALLLLLRAGDIAEEEGAEKVTEEHVEKAREKVEEDLIIEMIRTFPKHMKILLYTLAKLQESGGMRNLAGGRTLLSGHVYEEYVRTAKELGEEPVSARWFREYVSELNTYGIISVSKPVGIRGHTRILKLEVDPGKLKKVLESELL